MSESFLRFHVEISMRWEFYCDILKRCVFCDLSMEEFIFNSVDREDKKFNLHVKMEEKSSKRNGMLAVSMKRLLNETFEGFL